MRFEEAYNRFVCGICCLLIKLRDPFISLDCFRHSLKTYLYKRQAWFLRRHGHLCDDSKIVRPWNVYLFFYYYYLCFLNFFFIWSFWIASCIACWAVDTDMWKNWNEKCHKSTSNWICLKFVNHWVLFLYVVINVNVSESSVNCCLLLLLLCYPDFLYVK